MLFVVYFLQEHMLVGEWHLFIYTVCVLLHLCALVPGAFIVTYGHHGNLLTEYLCGQMTPMIIA